MPLHLHYVHQAVRPVEGFVASIRFYHSGNRSIQTLAFSEGRPPGMVRLH